MTKKYYRKEYTDKQWKALIDTAYFYRCKVTYSTYGSFVYIDSTEVETAAIQGHEERRADWAEHIHNQIQAATDIWFVVPKTYRKGYCPTVVRGKIAAEHKQEKLERETGFEWRVYADKVSS